MTRFLIFCIFCAVIYGIYTILKNIIPDPETLNNTIKLIFYLLIALGISINLFKL